MRRRAFLTVLGSAALARTARAFATELPQDLRITRVVGFDLVSRRSKVAGKNARLDVHGDQATDRMLRLFTNTGLEGFGNCVVNEEAAGQLLGHDPFEWYQREPGRFASPLRQGTMPLWDLLGKVLQKPVYELLGGAGPERVPVYDGSIYFADLLPQYESRWRERFREEIDLALADGHRAFKIKIGRGNKWMAREAGDDRDVEVVRSIREHAGANVLLGVDANNGYDLAGAKRFLERAGDVQLAFVEELLDEQVEACLELKAFLRERGWHTLVADGETQGQLDAFKPFIVARAIDVLQGDMNRFGVEGIMTEAAWAGAQKLLVAPHNWGSLVGYYMQLQVGRAIDNFYRAEHDPLSNRVLVAEGYERREGTSTVPASPGFGLSLREEAFASEARVRFDLR
ncbi:MAG: enolase C-terminal domain-like protein [Planctomycetaceae bacterium]